MKLYGLRHKETGVILRVITPLPQDHYLTVRPIGGVWATPNYDDALYVANNENLEFAACPYNRPQNGYCGYLEVVELEIVEK